MSKDVKDKTHARPRSILVPMLVNEEPETVEVQSDRAMRSLKERRPALTDVLRM